MTQALPDQVGPAAALYFVAWVVGSPCLTPSISHPNPIPNPSPNPSPNLSPNPTQDVCDARTATRDAAAEEGAVFSYEVSTP